MAASRADYEAAVRAIAVWAAAERLGGTSVEVVAREAVRRRNELKRRFRAGLPEGLLHLLEARNLAKYGDPLGPDADQLLVRYGDWAGVIAAAGRHSRLTRG